MTDTGYDILALLLTVLAGGVLGAIFFGGLWWTVHRSVVSKRPALWFVGSFLVRTSIALLGFYFVAQNQWQRFVACIVGFIIARVLVMYLTKSNRPTVTAANEETYHAS